MWPQGVPHVYELKAYTYSTEGVLGAILSVKVWHMALTFGLYTIQSLNPMSLGPQGLDFPHDPPSRCDSRLPIATRRCQNMR